MTGSANAFFVRAMLFELTLGVTAIGMGWLLRFDPLEPLSRDAGARSPLGNVAWGVAATIPLVAALLLLDHYPVGPLRDLQQLSRSVLIPLFSRQKTWQLLAVSAAAGFGEETLFRGLVQGSLQSWLAFPGGAPAACLVASLVFGLCHWLSATYAFLATLVGVYLGALYLATGSLVAPTIAHGLYDFLALVYLVKWRSAAEHTDTTDEVTDPGVESVNRSEAPPGEDTLGES